MSVSSFKKWNFSISYFLLYLRWWPLLTNVFSIQNVTNWNNMALFFFSFKGTTAHADATKLMYLEKPEWTEESIKAKVAISQLGLNLTSEIFKRYNATWPSLTAMISDIRTICPLLQLAKQIPSTSFYVATEVSLK